jgi:TatD DNase family protein
MNLSNYPMKLIDTHAHLDMPEFDKTLPEVLARAKKEEVVVVNCFLEPEGIPKLDGYDVFWSIGCCPYRFEDYEPQFKLMMEHMDKIVAVGEIGLDYYWIKEVESREREKKQFIRLLDLAKEYDKPVLIHSRNAEKHCLDILEEQKVEKAIMHCFSGNKEDGLRAIDLGYPISIPTNVVLSKQKQSFAREFPLESLVLETDAPYLSPEPKTINEPINVIKSAQKIADLRGIAFDEVAKHTTKTAREFFKI